MRTFVAAGAVLVASLNGVYAASSSDLCAGSSQEIGGNWYCKAVSAIAYANVAGAGKYMVPTAMSGGACPQAASSYNGDIAPMDEDVAMHFRGPLQLKQFAVYMPNSKSKREASAAHQRRHGHQHFHEHNAEVRDIQERAVEEREVVATINGQVVSWASNGAPGGAAPTPAAGSGSGGGSPASSPASGSAPAKPTSAGQAVTGDWTRTGYYNSQSQTLDGLVVLNHKGGSGSGVWDGNYGNSLSYASSDLTTGASSPQCLKDMTVPSNTEFAIFSDKKCGNDCGFVRPGTVAYEGFSGANKAFFFEFAMPDDGTSGWNMNMPAIWMLNAKIPRTLQYGEATCSCWETGCGEFDIFEVLDSGNTRMKSTFHMANAGGDSNYFKRPTSGTMKAMVLFKGDSQTVQIQVLDNSVNFGPSFTSTQINGFCSATTDPNLSLFTLG